MEDTIESAIPPDEVTRIAIRLRYLIEECIPCEMEEEVVTRSHSTVITRQVVQAAKEAGGEDYTDCVVCTLLLKVIRDAPQKADRLGLLPSHLQTMVFASGQD